jgi:hypothetical protein
MAKRVGGCAVLLVAVFVLPLLLRSKPAPRRPRRRLRTSSSSFPGLTVEQEANVIARDGGVLISSVPALRLYAVAVPDGDLAAVTAAYEADPQVQHVEPNKTRVSGPIPSDPYANQ